MSEHCPGCSEAVSGSEACCPSCGLYLHKTPTVTDTTPLDGEDASTGPPPKALDFAPGHVFAGRFTIIERVGEGGMGVVYKAIDKTLNDTVALKLIQPGRARAKDYVSRFRREVRLTRQITHPNVCRVHDLGETGEILYLSMEWITGDTLRQLLRKTRVLREERALEIAEKISRALTAAHERGIVHRDLKPENVMIDDRGEVHVMDFGLAVERGGDEITGAGVVIGTPRYMSPEQRRQEELDPRSDVFSLGLVLHEMLTGRVPHPVVPDAREIRSGVSRPIVPVLESLLAESKEARCPTAEAAGQLIRKLQKKAPAGPPTAPRWSRPLAWGAAASAVAAVIAAAIWLWPGPAASPAEPYYQRGLALRETAENERTIDDAIQMFRSALDLDAGYAPAWAALGEAYWKRYGWNRESSSRDEAVRAVERAFQLDAELPEARNAKATGYMAEREYRAARSELELAVAARPDLDAAWANLGRVDGQLRDYPAGLEALNNAIRLKPDSFRHQLALGLFFDGWAQYDEAVKAYRRATELKPDSTMAWNSLGTAYLRIQNHEAAVPAFRKSIEIEDRGINRSNLGTALYFLKDYEGAAENYKHAAQMEPGRLEYWGNQGDALRMLGKTPEARDAYLNGVRLARERLQASPGNADLHSLLGLYCARAQEETCDAMGEGRRAEELEPQNVEIIFRNAAIRCIKGRFEDALDWLERAIKLGLSKAQIENDPDLPSLSRYPRYQRLLELAS